jgi:S-adenosylmethionine-diacylglycerol 3-amino-3-carboxypropyl transferase
MKFLYNFGISQDDSESERKSLDMQKGDRLICLASAGELPLNLMSSADIFIDAVDISLPQLHLSRLKMMAASHLEPLEAARLIGYQPCTREERFGWLGQISSHLSESGRDFWNKHPEAFEKGPVHMGRFERYISNFNGLALQIIGRKKMMRLFEFDDIESQRQYFDQHLETKRLRFIFNVVFHPRIYKKRGMDEQGLTHSGERNIAHFFFSRFRNFCTSTLARKNHLLQFTFFNRIMFEEAFPDYLKPEGNELLRQRLDRISFFHEPISERIRKSPAGHYNKFALSNVGDWMTGEEMTGLFQIIANQSADKSRLLLRYIHAAHPVADHLKLIFSSDRELGNRLESTDRYPFYSLIPFELHKNSNRDDR